MADCKDLKVGDLVTLKPMEVTCVFSNGLQLQRASHERGDLHIGVRFDDIERVNRKFKVGDVVRYKKHHPLTMTLLAYDDVSDIWFVRVSSGENKSASVESGKSLSEYWERVP